MRAIVWFCGFYLLSACALLQNANAVETWKTYQGAWFSIDYPEDFRVTPSQKSSSTEGYDSVFFTAPDDTVSFYIFAPQWTGTATDIALDPISETLTAERRVQTGAIEVRWHTIAAKNSRYQRSYQTTFDSRGPSNWTIGIRYADSNAMTRWREQYKAFKSSLQLTAD